MTLQESLSPVLIERASEQLRQERETFDLRKGQEQRWFGLRLLMGYSSIALLAAIIVIAAYILIHHTEFSAGVVVSAGAALFTDVLGLLVGVWRIALNPNFITRLEPVTNTNATEHDIATVRQDSTTSNRTR